MTTESTYRAMVLASLALCLPIGVYHRVRSLASRERLARREEGLFILVGLRLCGILGWVVVLVYLADPDAVAWARLAVPPLLRWVGAAISVLLVPPLLYWTLHSLGKNLTDTVVTRRNHALVMHGPYRWVRHPFYDVVFLWGFSLFLVTANGLFLLLGVAFALLIVVRTRVEEAKLIERFGAAYRDYAARTGRFVPRLRTRGQAADSGTFLLEGADRPDSNSKIEA
jgi:protein-S-isoprenylcysteine O-methyltransferase Ste14